MWVASSSSLDILSIPIAVASSPFSQNRYSPNRKRATVTGLLRFQNGACFLYFTKERKQESTFSLRCIPLLKKAKALLEEFTERQVMLRRIGLELPAKLRRHLEIQWREARRRGLIKIAHGCRSRRRRAL